MRNQVLSRDGLAIAIFSRNHGKYLSAAASRPAGKRVTFRARKKWISAAKALRTGGSVPIYFAVVGQPPRVEYIATLCEVLLDPSSRAKKTQEVLRHSLPASSKEGLWESSRTRGPARTLYVITNCRRLKQPFPITRLRKRNGSPLSSDYKYSYSVVRPVAAVS